MAMCPFGTLSLDLFTVKTSQVQTYDLSIEEEVEAFIKEFPSEVVAGCDSTIINDPMVFPLTDQVFIREYKWFENKPENV
jgi:hypothetical protein